MTRIWLTVLVLASFTGCVAPHLPTAYLKRVGSSEHGAVDLVDVRRATQDSVHVELRYPCGRTLHGVHVHVGGSDLPLVDLDSPAPADPVVGDRIGYRLGDLDAGAGLFRIDAEGLERRIPLPKEPKHFELSTLDWVVAWGLALPAGLVVDAGVFAGFGTLVFLTGGHASIASFALTVVGLRGWSELLDLATGEREEEIEADWRAKRGRNGVQTVSR